MLKKGDFVQVVERTKYGPKDISEKGLILDVKIGAVRDFYHIWWPKDAVGYDTTSQEWQDTRTVISYGITQGSALSISDVHYAGTKSPINKGDSVIVISLSNLPEVSEKDLESTIYKVIDCSDNVYKLKAPNGTEISGVLDWQIINVKDLPKYKDKVPEAQINNKLRDFLS